MITAPAMTPHHVVHDAWQKTLRDNAVVKTPADVAGTGIGHVCPEGIGTSLLGIQMPEGVHIAQGQ